MPEPAITPELIEKHGLTAEEYQQILKILGREPNITELGIFSVMWSEHCSYKNTRPLLKGFPTKTDKVLVAAGEENAGILDIGDGVAIAFKIESHNHPSAVEPFQGAATGVGGILRDIFTMGARPICGMNSLRFGNLESAEVRRLFRGVVEGIAHYGNCFGIPTIAGEVSFDASYEGNPLVNAFALGSLYTDQIARGAAEGIGNPVFYVGPATGRDGLAGAAFASQDLTEESAEHQRGAVQVGDPFMEKLVMEACLELLATGAVAGIQDMGAAGLTCSTCETASRAGTGIEIELDKVPQRGPKMSSYEIMLSESQERMLIIVHKGREDEVKKIFDKWDLPWAQVGVVTDTGQMVVRHGGEIVADIPAARLADEAPIYYREAKEPDYFSKTRSFEIDSHPDLDSSQVGTAFLQLLSSPTIASKNWVYRQYDHMVRNGSVVLPGSDAAVIRVKEDSMPVLPGNEKRSFPDKYIAMAVDGNGLYSYLDPHEGGKIAVAECVRNLAASGATPLGITDNLNFGNPHNPELFFQLKEAVEGMSEACRHFNIPVTGGNVSLYNQSPAGAIDPTPVVGAVGIIENQDKILTQWIKNEGNILLVLEPKESQLDAWQGLGGSAYLKSIHGLKVGRPAPCNLDLESSVQNTLLDLNSQSLILSAHDCSDGGLLSAIAEMSISRNFSRNEPNLIGVDLDFSKLQNKYPRLDSLLFGEFQSRIVVEVKADQLDAINDTLHDDVEVIQIGKTGGNHIKLTLNGTELLNSPVEHVHDGWWNAIGNVMDA